MVKTFNISNLDYLINQNWVAKKKGLENQSLWHLNLFHYLKKKNIYIPELLNIFILCNKYWTPEIHLTVPNPLNIRLKGLYNLILDSEIYLTF